MQKKSLLLDKAANVFHDPHLHLVLQHKLVNLVGGGIGREILDERKEMDLKHSGLDFTDGWIVYN